MRAIASLIAAISVAALVPVVTARAMDISVVRDQLILSGRVIGDEYARVAGLLANGPQINTVILRNSPGGHIATGYRLGELFRAKHIRTGVSGFCFSSCSRMFLGGESRYFTDDFSLERTDIGFHGHYRSDGSLNAGAVRSFGLKAWIIRFSDGRADASLVERWINIPFNGGLIHFFHPELSKRRGFATFICQGNETVISAFNCEAIPKTALELGIVTSTELLHSNDQDMLRARFGPKPPPSGFASINDETRVPVSGGGRAEYLRFIERKVPRAFAVSADGKSWAWVSGRMDANLAAIERCNGGASGPCSLYAVDEEVVWNP